MFLNIQQFQQRYIICLLKDPFDPDEFVERLAWRTAGGVSRGNTEDFDPMLLHAAFEKTIRELKEMNVRIQNQVESLETQCTDEEKVHWQRVAELQKHNQVDPEKLVFSNFFLIF